jgi:hypothetical protein
MKLAPDTGRPAAAAILLLLLVVGPPAAMAGPYAPAAEQPGSTAVSKNDQAIVAWATDWQDYRPGEAVDLQWQTPALALGPARETSFDIVCLGRGGEITMVFAGGIGNGPGWDFAVFENSFSDTFLELAYVEVSSDGIHFFQFPSDSLTPGPVGGFGSLDPTDVNGLAGKYRQGWGTPFDLAELAYIGPELNVNRIRYVRIVDVVGDGGDVDTSGDVIYDPYPTVGSAGFDLDAVGVIHAECRNNFPPETPAALGPPDGQTGLSLNPILVGGAFADLDTAACSFHLSTRWQIKTGGDFIGPDDTEPGLVLDAVSTVNRISLPVAGSILEPATTYFWRLRHLDNGGQPSAWSASRRFTTAAVDFDSNGNGIPDLQELAPTSPADLNRDGIADVVQIDDQYKVLATTAQDGRVGLMTAGNATLAFVESIDPESIPDQPPGAKPALFLLGVLNFRVEVPTPGETAAVRIYFSASAPAGYRWFKYNPAVGWTAMPGSLARFSSDGRSVLLHLEDGGPYDGDGLVNGVIIDPGGAGSLEDQTPPPDGEAGISGGCFIETSRW